MRLKISSRSSDLARWQAYAVAEALKKTHPQLEIEFHFRESLGDKNLTDPLWKIPEKGVFTEDFYKDLQSGETDMVVHSWKDLPVEDKSDTQIAATLPRADMRDLLLFKKSSLHKKNVRILSSSPRRAYNLKNFFFEAWPWRPETLEFVSVRGNIPTRIRKLLEDSEADGLILAKAALDRLTGPLSENFPETRATLLESLKQLQHQVLPLSISPAAAAQGALAIEILSSREDLKTILNSINCEKTFTAAQAERETLKGYGGGCHQKIGVSYFEVHNVKMVSLQGETDQGEVLHKFETETTPLTQYSESELLDSRDLWSEVVRESSSQFSNGALGTVSADSSVGASVGNSDPTSVRGRRVLVTRPDLEIPELTQAREVWVAGTETWKSLARNGIWVNGSLDSCGDSQLPRLTVALDTDRWLRLTHEEATNEETREDVQSISVYRVSRQPHSSQVLRDKKMIFWRSGGEFLQALKVWPEIINLRHACGLGSTREALMKHLKAGQLEPYLNAAEWRSKCQK